MATETPHGRTLRSDARRNLETILGAAREALATDPGASMGAIAARAGGHRATVHRHFASRDDLIAALHARMRDECGRALERALAGGGRPRAVLERVTSGWLDIGDRYRLQQYGVLLSPGVTRGSEWHEMGDRVVELLASGARAGELRDDVPPDVLAALWAGMLLAAGELVAQAGRRPEDVARDVVRLVAR